MSLTERWLPRAHQTRNQQRQRSSKSPALALKTHIPHFLAVDFWFLSAANTASRVDGRGDVEEAKEFLLEGGQTDREGDPFISSFELKG